MGAAEAGAGAGVRWAQILFARYLKAASESFPEIISLADPTWRKQSTIWSSSGSRLAILKYLAAGDGVVVSLI